MDSVCKRLAPDSTSIPTHLTMTTDAYDLEVSVLQFATSKAAVS